jgi:hypothetical protein
VAADSIAVILVWLTGTLRQRAGRRTAAQGNLPSREGTGPRALYAR